VHVPIAFQILFPFAIFWLGLFVSLRCPLLLLICYGLRSPSLPMSRRVDPFVDLPEKLRFFHNSHRDSLKRMVDAAANASTTQQVVRLGFHMGEFARGLDAHHRIEGQEKRSNAELMRRMWPGAKTGSLTL
jgi:hypothetical protein